MSPRQARRERREAERKARKAEIKRMKAARHTPAEPPSILSPEFSEATPAGFVSQFQNPDREGGDSPSAEPAPTPAGFVSQLDEPALLSEAKIQLDEPAFLSEAKTQTRREINLANALHSTGPRSIAGKLASSRNSLQHGLASGTMIIPGEDPAQFEHLTAALLEEHQPAGNTEALLVHEMARSWWLTQRAIRLQNECFTDTGIDEKRLSLLLRYQTTHERAFHKALNTLIKLKRIQNRTPTPQSGEGIGFVSQNAVSSATEIGFVSQNPDAELPNPPPTLAEAA